MRVCECASHGMTMQLLLQYVHAAHSTNVTCSPAVQCVEVSWTSAFFCFRALTDVLFSLFVPSALRGVQHVYDLHVSVLQELCVGLVVFIKLERVPWFRVRKLVWFGVRGGWPPQFQLRLVRLYVAGFNLTVESECVFKTSSNWVLHLSSCI